MVVREWVPAGRAAFGGGGHVAVGELVVGGHCHLVLPAVHADMPLDLREEAEGVRGADKARREKVKVGKRGTGQGRKDVYEGMRKGVCGLGTW